MGGFAVAQNYPLKSGANGRYLVDQSNVPFLMVGDSPHSLIANLDDGDAATYLANRASNGFNCIWVETLCFPYTGGRSDGSLLDGTLPFTNMLSSGYYDLTSPSPDYFSHVDTVLQMAATNNILVLLDPCETGGWLATMTNNGSNSCWIFGQYLGNRYSSFSNIIWLNGNDFDVSEWSIETNDVCVMAVASGIASVDTNHIQTVELGANYAYPDSLSDSNWWPMIALDAVYDYSQSYAGCSIAYRRANFRPLFMAEQHYENEMGGDLPDNIELGTPLVLRHQEYWTMLSGATGQLYGNRYIWPFMSGWQDNLNTVGVQQLQYNTAFFKSRAWWTLVPDMNHTLLTAGYGTFATNGLISTNDYATAATTPDGSLAVIYTPTGNTLTVNLSMLRAPVNARWYDPTGGGYAAIPGSPFLNGGSQVFTPPGENSIGDGDWVLALETNTPADAVIPRFVQQNFATPQISKSLVPVTYTESQMAGDANIVTIGWGDTNTSINSVSDTAGNVYQVAVPTFRGNGVSQAIYYATGIAGGSNTVTVQFNQLAKFVDFRVTEYAGLSKTNILDSANSATGTSSNVDSGSASVTAKNDLIFGAGYTLTGFTAPGSGFTQRLITAPDGDIVEDQIATGLGAYDATATAMPGGWLMQVAAFRADQTLAPIAPKITGTLLASNGSFVVQFSTVLGQNYQLEASSAPSTNSWLWAPVVSGIPGTGGVVQASDTNAVGQTRQFYRVKAGF